MRSTYSNHDVTLLLKDITGMVEPQPTEVREKLIQSGTHYCEMLPIEYSPSQKYWEAYETALKNYSSVTAKAVGIVADKIMNEKNNKVVLVSLARAGLPIGILIKRYIKRKYNIDVNHYGISIIRGRGIDKNAMNYILTRHRPEDIQFIDGWIGKGAILRELKKDLEDFPNVSPNLAVLADPANMTELCGTHEDILIPSSCLNCTVSGLISRTFLRHDIIGPTDFHGAVYYGELLENDVSELFLTAIEEKFVLNQKPEQEEMKLQNGIEEVKKIMSAFNISDINFIKPGIGEATRVLLRRLPWKILIDEKDKNSFMLKHLLKLAKEKNVPVEYYPFKNYKACGIVKNCSDM